jgi:Xaa-Pro aminopeptidase
MRPGTPVKEIFTKYNAYMTRNGMPTECRLYAHGQGYDMVERPLIRQDDDMMLHQGMCLAVHPGYETPSLFAVICDNYLIEAHGPGD